ncbi:MAG: signal transduction histidine kinase [Planctomycetota bacterium]|jgi:signal transduction histidine kinase
MLRIRLHFFFALGTLALLNFGSLMLIPGMFSAARPDSAKIHAAARQRMLSQRIVGSAMTLQLAERNGARAELGQALLDFEAGHRVLVKTTAVGHPVHELLTGLEGEFVRLLGSGRAVLQLGDNESAMRVHAAAAAFLPKMDAAVNAYEEEGQAKAARVRARQVGVLIATLLILIAEAALVFEPLCRRVARDESALKAGRDAALGSADARKRFLSTVSHEIRTPLHGVIGTTSLLLQSGLTVNQASLARAGKRSAENLLAMLNGVLDHAKLQEGAMTLESAPFSLEEMQEDLELSRHSPYRGTGVELVVEAKDDVPRWVVGDATRLRQVLLNIVSNGLKFTSEGEVRVTFEWDSREHGSALLVEIADTGIGIRAERLDSIFLEYTQAEVSTAREYGGTGLGLSISRELIKLMGGTLEVTSVMGVGSRFSIRLPATAAAGPDPTQALGPIIGSRDLSTIRVLAADDDEVNRRVLGLHLKALVGSYTVVENGAQVVEEAKKGVFDVLLLDLSMPVMGGRDATLAVRDDSLCSSALIVAVTGETDEESIRRCLESGFDALLSKPFRRDELESILALNSSSQSASDRAA